MILIFFTSILSGCVPHKLTDKPVLKIGYLPITHAALPLVVYAQSNDGEFENFKLEMIRFSGWAEMAEAIQAGKIDGGGSILSSLAIKIASNGVPFQTVLMLVRDGNVIVVSNEINNAQDLKGKIIAIPSRFSSHYIMLHQYLADNGLVAGVDVNTPDMAPPDMVQALSAGSIDGYVVAEPFGAKAEELNIGKILVFSNDVDTPGIRSDECVLALRTEFIDSNPEAVQELVDKIITAGIWVEENQEEAAELLSPYLGQEKEIILHSFNTPQNRTQYIDLFPRKEEYAAFQEYMIKIDLLEERINMDNFVNESFAEEAYQKYNLEKLEW